MLARMKKLGRPFHYVVTATTRPKRAGEKNGVDYHFLARKEFQQMIDNHQFLEWANVYGSQRELLCRLHEVRSKDVFVAAYTAVQHSDSRRISSYCVWTDGVDSLLPRADDVFFTWGDEPDSEEGEHLKVRWAIVERTCGDLMEATGDYPPRYRVRAFPDLSRLQAMRAASEPVSRA